MFTLGPCISFPLLWKELWHAYSLKWHIIFISQFMWHQESRHGLKGPLLRVTQGISQVVSQSAVFPWVWGPPGSSDSKESACNAGDPGSIPGLGRPPGEGNSYPFQSSCMENSMERGDWWATVHRVTKIQIQLSNSHSHFTFHFHRLKPVPHQRIHVCSTRC